MHDEILGSKHDLENKLGISCDYISWPYGRLSDSNESALAFIKTSGFHACFSAVRGKLIPGKTDAFAIPRHHFEPHWPLSHIKYFALGGMERGS